MLGSHPLLFNFVQRGRVSEPTPGPAHMASRGDQLLWRDCPHLSRLEPYVRCFHSAFTQVMGLQTRGFTHVRQLLQPMSLTLSAYGFQYICVT